MKGRPKRYCCNTIAYAPVIYRFTLPYGCVVYISSIVFQVADVFGSDSEEDDFIPKRNVREEVVLDSDDGGTDACNLEQ